MTCQIVFLTSYEMRQFQFTNVLHMMYEDFYVE